MRRAVKRWPTGPKQKTEVCKRLNLLNNPGVQDPTPGTGGEVTFTQAEVDALISKEKQER